MLGVVRLSALVARASLRLVASQASAPSRDLGKRRNPRRQQSTVATGHFSRCHVSNHFAFADFVDEHPGGARVIQRMGGKDATKAFWKYHGESVLAKYGEKFKIGTVTESAKL